MGKEIVDWCVALVKQMAERHATAYAANTCQYRDYEEAARIAKKMVDPDVLKARSLRFDQLGEHASAEYRKYLTSGAYDNDEDIQFIVRAIKYGREQEKAA